MQAVADEMGVKNWTGSEVDRMFARSLGMVSDV